MGQTGTHAAPARQESRRFLPALGTWAFFLTFSGQGVRNIVGWVPFGGIAAVSGILLLVVFVREGHRIPWRSLPVASCAYTALCVLSLAWSQFPHETALAAALMAATSATGILLGCGLSLRQLTVALGRALEATIALSLALEAYVALILGRPLPPLYMRHWEHIPPSYYWSEARLLQGGPIQGIIGNRNPLAFVALLTLICVVVRWRDDQISRSHLLVWSTLCLVTLLLTRSATVTVAAVVCGALALLLWWLRRLEGGRRRRAVVLAAGAGVTAGLLALVFHRGVTMLLGRSSDMTGRWVIWERVIELWQERPILGWGWIMYWEPWIPLFQTLVIRPDGTPTMSAHNAYVEALFQTGIVGALLIVVLMVQLLLQTGRLALRYLDSDPSVLLPVLLTTALAVQALTESRLLSEGNWVVVCALGTWLGLYRRVEMTASHRHGP
ncbi:O-antigen ligase family protein [Actinomyces oricola]